MAQDTAPPNLVLTSCALVAAALVVLNTGVQILPDDAIAAGVPVLSILTVQRLVVLVGLACLVVARPRSSTFATPVDIPLLVLVAVAGYASVQADQSLAAWRALLTAVAVLYLVVGLVRSHPDAVPVLMTCVLGAALVAGAIAVQQVSTGFDTGFYREGLRNVDEESETSFVRATGTFTNPNLLAGYLIMAVPLSAGIVTASWSRRARLACFVLVGASVAGLFLTFSRAALFSLVVVALAALAVRLILRPGTRPLAVPAMVVVGTGSAVLVFGVLASGLMARIAGREALWDAAEAAAVQGGIDGVGYGRAGDIMTSLSGQEYAHAHNLWLNWLVDVGPLGPVLITLILGIAVVAGLRRAMAGSRLAAGATVAVLAVSIASLTDHPTTIARNLLLLFVAIACTVAEALRQPPAAGRHLHGARRILPEPIEESGEPSAVPDDPDDGHEMDDRNEIPAQVVPDEITDPAPAVATRVSVLPPRAAVAPAGDDVFKRVIPPAGTTPVPPDHEIDLTADDDTTSSTLDPQHLARRGRRGP